MSPTQTGLSRRQLLRGAGGAALALPLLPSLLPRSAWAQEAPRLPCFAAFATHHGGVLGPSMYPPDETLEAAELYAGRRLHVGALVPEDDGSDAVLSEVLRAPAHRLTPAMAARLAVLRGLDIPWYIAHHTGGHLGNFARNDGNGGEGLAMQDHPTPTIDQVMAWSPRFYPDVSGVVERSMVVGAGRLSHDFARPSARSGPIQERYATTSSADLFRRLFRPAEAFGRTSPLLVDRVLGHYRELRGAAGLSADDARRLDEHVERLHDIERRISMEIPCSPAEPALDTLSLHASETYFRDPEAQALSWSLMNDIVVAAMACGVSRIATLHVADTFSDFAGDWHQDIAHQAYLPGSAAQAAIVAAHQRFFSGVFLDLVEKLAATELAAGDTLLDRALVVWSQESGQYTHDSTSMPVVTAGEAAGAWQSGLYADYRNRELDIPFGEDDGSGDFPVDHPGLGWNQYLGSVLQAMGLDPSEYETEGTGGYGPWMTNRDNYDHAETVLGEALPVVMG